MNLVRIFKGLSVRCFLVIACIGLANASVAYADNGDAHFTHTDSKITTMLAPDGSEHQLTIRLPASYRDSGNEDRTYPVLYLLDAHWDYPLLSAIYNNLRYDGAIPELIIVGLGYPGKDDSTFSQRRLFDYTPTPMDVAPEGYSGGGPQFLDFIKHTVAPYIDSNYRTDINDRALAGTSNGGLFALWAMYQDPEFFKRYIALSPFVIYDYGVLLDVDQSYVEANSQLNADVFYAYGKDEHETWQAAAEFYADTVRSRHYQGLTFTKHRIPGVGHAGIKNVGYSQALQHLYRDLAPEGPNNQDMEVEMMEVFGMLEGIFDHKIKWYLPKGNADESWEYQ